MHIYALFILLFIPAESVHSFPYQMPAATSPASEKDSGKNIGRHVVNEVNGLLMLDYQTIPVPSLKPIDLHGIHYLQKINDWFYFGVGLHAPLVEGNYGGFMTYGASAHAQKRLADNFLVQGGISFGGGGGGETVGQSIELSGTGGFVKSYLGFGYSLGDYIIGVNYSDFRMVDSLINHGQVGVFIQKPVSYLAGSYMLSDDETSLEGMSFIDDKEKVVTVEFNNLLQKQPAGSYQGTINTLSVQSSFFLSQKMYYFFGFEAGYLGLPLYNHFLGGVGYRAEATSKIDVFGQLAIGSGGFSPSKIDTGSGLLVYPKVYAEYKLNDGLGLSLSGGWLFAPKGTSKNVTFGAAIQYHFLPLHSSKRSLATKLLYKGVRFDLFHQSEYGVSIGNKEHPNIHMLTLELDYPLNHRWYVPFQTSIAYNDFLGYPGYGEVLLGLGIQSEPKRSGINLFFQTLVGANIHGIIVKPSVGISYNVNDKFAIYSQWGKTEALRGQSLYRDGLHLSAYYMGLGVTYRFSLVESRQRGH